MLQRLRFYINNNNWYSKQTVVGDKTFLSLICLRYSPSPYESLEGEMGSLGNFNLQINLQVYNQFPYAINPEIVIIPVNSGIFVSERGTSSTYTGILTKSDVLAVAAQEPYYQKSVKRLIGGSFLDSLKSVSSKILPHLFKYGKEELGKSEHPVAKLAHSAMGAMGYGSTGGGSSGGRMRLADRLMQK